jgi:hypothetical protein
MDESTGAWAVRYNVLVFVTRKVDGFWGHVPEGLKSRVSRRRGLTCTTYGLPEADQSLRLVQRANHLRLHDTKLHAAEGEHVLPVKWSINTGRGIVDPSEVLAISLVVIKVHVN